MVLLTKNGLPTSASAPVLPTLRVTAHTRSMLLDEDALHLPTPGTNRDVELLLPPISHSTASAPRLGLGRMTVEANAAQQELVERLQRYEAMKRARGGGGSSSLAVNALAKRGGGGGTSSLAASQALSELTMLMSGLGHAFSGDAVEKQAQARDAEAEEARRREREEERRREAERRRKEAEAAARRNQLSKPTSNAGETRRAIQAKIQRLREDPEALALFSDYCATLTRVTDQTVVERNTAAIAGASPAEYLASLRAAQAAREATFRQRRAQAQAKVKAILEEKAAKAETAAHAKAESHEMTIARHRRARDCGRALRWFAIAALIGRTNALGTALVAARAARAERVAHAASQRTIEKAWRRVLVFKRLRTLRRGLATLRRGVWWWRFRSRIKKKREAWAALVDYLRAQNSNKRSSVAIKLFLFKVRRVQRAWRRAWTVIRAQVEVLLLHFAVQNDKNRKEPMYDVERRIRAQVLRKDLRDRKGKHVGEVDEWKRKVADYEGVREMEAMMQSARDLLSGKALQIQSRVRGNHARKEAAARAAEVVPHRLSRVPTEKLKTEGQRKERREEKARAARAGALLEQQGVVPPGARPRFRLFFPPEHGARVLSKVKAKHRSANTGSPSFVEKGLDGMFGHVDPLEAAAVAVGGGVREPSFSRSRSPSSPSGPKVGGAPLSPVDFS